MVPLAWQSSLQSAHATVLGPAPGIGTHRHFHSCRQQSRARLVRVDTGFDLIYHPLRVDGGALFRHDHRGNRLGPPVVRQHRDGLGDVLVGGVYGLLDLDGGDILGAGLDDVLAPVAEPQDAVVIDVTDVAGVEPAVAKT